MKEEDDGWGAVGEAEGGGFDAEAGVVRAVGEGVLGVVGDYP